MVNIKKVYTDSNTPNTYTFERNGEEYKYFKKDSMCFVCVMGKWIRVEYIVEKIEGWLKENWATVIIHMEKQ